MTAQVQRPSSEVGGTVLTTHDALDALRADWDDLWARTPGASAFQSHAWVSSWARAYAGPGTLRVAVVRRDGALVAGAALVEQRRGPFRVLAPLGGAITDVTDVLLDPAAAGALSALADTLVRLPGWDSLDLPELPPGAAGLGLADRWPGRTWSAPSSLSLELPALPLADVFGRLPSRTAGTLRRKQRKAGSVGVQRTEVTDPADLARAVDDLVALHRAQWAGRGGNPEHLTGRFRDHLVGALEGLVPAGAAVLAEYRVDGRLLASQIDLVDGRAVSYYLAGIDPELRALIDTAVLLATSDLALALDRGVPRYSMLRGREDYKLRWRPEEVWATRLVLVRPSSLRAGAHLGAVVVRHEARERARPAVREARRRWAELRSHPRLAARRSRPDAGL